MKKLPVVFASRFGTILLLILILQRFSFAQEAPEQKEPGYIVVDGGIYSCLDLWATTGFVNLQFQPGIKLWILRPQAGVLVSFSGAVMIYGGLTWPAVPVKWLVIETGAAAGYYESGEGIDLQFPLEFRLSLSVMYRFRNYIQLGAGIAHISNANLSPPNPGTESISVIFKIPLQKRRAY